MKLSDKIGWSSVYFVAVVMILACWLSFSAIIALVCTGLVVGLTGIVTAAILSDQGL